VLNSHAICFFIEAGVWVTGYGYDLDADGPLLGDRKCFTVQPLNAVYSQLLEPDLVATFLKSTMNQNKNKKFWEELIAYFP
jgi:hypothetical protein